MLKRFACALSLGLSIAAGTISCAGHAAPAQPPSTIPAPAPPPPSAPAPAPPVAATPAPEPQPAALPERLTDQEFWKLIGDLSEPGGSFRSDNLLSNEVWLQYVIPDLLNVARPGRVYMGVGPEQNFTYIAALKPAMVFITDVRRGNLHLHLMYKALFEMSADRPEFVSRLFSRKRPAGLTAASSVQQLFAAYAGMQKDDALFEANFAAIMNHLRKTHGFTLEPGDEEGIKFVYEYFAMYGPDLTYWMSGGFGRGGGFRNNSPTYGDLMVATDGAGTYRSYLASEENFNVLKTLHTKNLFVPVVGNFGGPKALRAVGAWVKRHSGMVSAFYLSNVEQYLQQDGIWDTFCRNATTLPIDASSQFIRSFRGGTRGFGGGGGSLDSGIFPMVDDLKGCQ
jgi:hypothetical protein